MLAADQPLVDLIDVVEGDLAVAEILGRHPEGVALEQQVRVLGDHHHLVVGQPVGLGDLGDAVGAGEDVIVARLGRIGIVGGAVGLPGQQPAGWGPVELLRVGLVLEETIDAVVDEILPTVLEHLSGHEAGGVADAVGLGARTLEPPELLDDLVHEHDDVPVHEKTVESIGILDQRRSVGDIDRAGKIVCGDVHCRTQSTILERDSFRLDLVDIRTRIRMLICRVNLR